MTNQEVADELELSLAQVKHGYRRARGLDENKDRKGYEERKPQVYKDEDMYTVISRSRNSEHTVKITENSLRQLKKFYCLEGMTINQVCREMRLPRRDFYLIKTAFSITKDDVPVIDEDLITEDIDSLVVDNLQERKRLYFVKLQQKEIDLLRKENKEYRKKDYFINKVRENTVEDLQRFAKNYSKPEPTKKNTVDSNADYMLEVPVVDLHLSKLSYEPEVGESYDYKIAEKRYRDGVSDVYERAKAIQPAKILIPIGNDFFHTDTIQGTTTAGTPQDFDGRWQKLFVKGAELLVWTFDLFSTIGKVDGLLVPGNHDKMVSYYALMYLYAWFRANERVNIDIDPKARKYVEFGKNLIGFTHGDKERKRIFGNMQVESAEGWGRTKYREFHIGHWHHESTKEEHGVIVRSLSSLTATDAWHFEHGYSGSIAKQQSFLWHKTKGLREIWHTNI